VFLCAEDYWCGDLGRIGMPWFGGAGAYQDVHQTRATTDLSHNLRDNLHVR